MLFLGYMLVLGMPKLHGPIVGILDNFINIYKCHINSRIVSSILAIANHKDHQF